MKIETTLGTAFTACMLASCRSIAVINGVKFNYYTVKVLQVEEDVSSFGKIGTDGIITPAPIFTDKKEYIKAQEIAQALPIGGRYTITSWRDGIETDEDSPVDIEIDGDMISDKEIGDNFVFTDGYMDIVFRSKYGDIEAPLDVSFLFKAGWGDFESLVFEGTTVTQYK